MKSYAPLFSLKKGKNLLNPLLKGNRLQGHFMNGLSLHSFQNLTEGLQEFKEADLKPLFLKFVLLLSDSSRKDVPVQERPSLKFQRGLFVLLIFQEPPDQFSLGSASSSSPSPSEETGSRSLDLI